MTTYGVTQGVVHLFLSSLQKNSPLPNSRINRLSNLKTGSSYYYAFLFLVSLIYSKILSGRNILALYKQFVHNTAVTKNER